MTLKTQGWRAAGGRGVVLITAAPAEARAICRAAGCHEPERDWEVVRLGDSVDMVRSGVGKVNAALAVAKSVDPARHGLVLNVGVCGAYGAAELAKSRLLSVIVASASVYADEGIATEQGHGFTSMAEAGFGPGGSGGSGEHDRAFAGMGVGDEGVCAEIQERLGTTRFERGVVMTVSCCSGTDALKNAYASRHAGAIAEAMEGAAAGHAVARLFGERVRFGEVRVVSNTTGDRQKQVWKLPEALDVLGRTVRTLIEARAITG